MSEESLKSCVRVLRVEAKWRYILGKIIHKLIDYIPNINWCIVRSIWRWFGIPIALILAVILIQPREDPLIGWLSVSLCFGVAVIIAGTFISWTDSSDIEERILHDQYCELYKKDFTKEK
jgi:hypothetical protein